MPICLVLHSNLYDKARISVPTWTVAGSCVEQRIAPDRIGAVWVRVKHRRGPNQARRCAGAVLGLAFLMLAVPAYPQGSPPSEPITTAIEALSEYSLCVRSFPTAVL